jgi:hypothetical protein
MSKQLYYALPSLYAYRCFGAVLPIICMIFWWASHYFWINNSATWLINVVVIMGIMSTKSYAATFAYQNYNVVGWMFFPLGVWALFNEYYWLSAFAWLLASYGSVTVVAVALWLTAAIAASTMNYLPILTIIPALLKLVTHFGKIDSKNEKASNIVVKITRTIGLAEKKAKYKRKTGKKITIKFVYFLTLYLLFWASFYVLTGNVSVVWSAAIFLYVMNMLVIRFADHQSIHMMMLGLSSALVLDAKEALLLMPYWLVISPLPRFLLIHGKTIGFEIPPKLSPFRISTIIAKVETFLSSVEQGQRVLMAFKDPKGEYENIFDGYRRILEVPLYVASKKGIHFMPDWWAVFDTNYEGAPNIWGRNLSEVNENATHWSCDFVVVYQGYGTQLDNQWVDSGYQVMSCMDWSDYIGELRGVVPWKSETPKWWLLKVPSS